MKKIFKISIAFLTLMIAGFVLAGSIISDSGSSFSELVNFTYLKGTEINATNITLSGFPGIISSGGYINYNYAALSGTAFPTYSFQGDADTGLFATATVVGLSVDNSNIFTFTKATNILTFFKNLALNNNDLTGIKVLNTTTLNADNVNAENLLLSNSFNITNDTMYNLRNLRSNVNMNWGTGAFPFKINFGFPDTTYGALLTIRPYTPTTGGLILKQRNSSQSANLMEVQNDSGDNINWAIGPDGQIVSNININKALPGTNFNDTSGGEVIVYLSGDEFRIRNASGNTDIIIFNMTSNKMKLNMYAEIECDNAVDQSCLTIDQDRPWDAMKIESGSTQKGLYIVKEALLATTKATFEVYDNQQQKQGLASISCRNDHTGNAIPCIYSRSDGSGPEFQAAVNTTSKICNATFAGGIYFDSATNKHRGCDGSSWNDMY